MAKDNCNCLHGTAGYDANGNCICTDNSAPNTTRENCTGVWIEGVGCTGGIKGIPAIVNEPLPQAGYEQFGMFGQKRKVTNTCSQIGAPNGYQYILNANGQCVLAVKYDYDTTQFGGGAKNALDSLLGGSDLGTTIANNKGLIGLGVAGVIAYFLFGRDKDGTATSRTVISRRGIS